MSNSLRIKPRRRIIHIMLMVFCVVCSYRTTSATPVLATGLDNIIHHIITSCVVV